MSLTFKQVLNRVLAVLGEDLVTGTLLQSEYHKKLGAFANIIKEEIEDAHNWRSLQTPLTASLTAGNTTVDISGSTNRSRLVRLHQQNASVIIPAVFDVTDTKEPYNMREIDLQEWVMRSEAEDDTQAQVTEPGMFALGINSSTLLVRLHVWPPPKASRNYNLRMVVPQGHLDETQASIDTVIKIPARPLIVGTLWYALEDRGEELGPNSLFTAQRYMKALDDAISMDSAEQGDYHELVAV